MEMVIVEIPLNQRESHGEGTKLCGIPAGMSRYLTFMVHLQQKWFSNGYRMFALVLLTHRLIS